MRTTPPTLDQLRDQRTEALARRPPEALARIGADLGAVAAARAAEVVGNRRSNGLEYITAAETRAVFERSFALSEKMADYIDLPTPTPKDMAEAGINYEYLADEYERMDAAGLKPHIVLAPHGLGKAAWETIFSKARQDTSIPHNPLQKGHSGDGLYVSSGAVIGWDSFDKVPEHIDIFSQTTSAAHLQALWTLRIMPGTATPQHLSMSYTDTLIIGSIKHQTVPELLTDKLASIQAGETPSDEGEFSWCDNHDPASARAGQGSAPIGRWSAGSGYVRVNNFRVGVSTYNIGSRSLKG